MSETYCSIYIIYLRFLDAVVFSCENNNRDITMFCSEEFSVFFCVDSSWHNEVMVGGEGWALCVCPRGLCVLSVAATFTLVFNLQLSKVVCFAFRFWMMLLCSVQLPIMKSYTPEQFLVFRVITNFECMDKIYMHFCSCSQSSLHNNSYVWYSKKMAKTFFSVTWTAGQQN